jgi:hypothetical protein
MIFLKSEAMIILSRSPEKKRHVNAPFTTLYFFFYGEIPQVTYI